MGKLTCEMCGSTDLIKQDGVFVCQACGTKYSAEEAKKMMVEGTEEVQSMVTANQPARLDNLLTLAHSSFDSKNYAQAEEFCNQVIAIDSNNFDAWKLKGESINFQISSSNDRITEVYNCIMTSYRVLDKEGKNEHREEILASLRACLEGEIDFALDLFKNKRPSDDMLTKVKNTFINCAANVITSYEELGYADQADAYRTYIKNYFIKKVNNVTETTWKDVVYYNYHRGGWTDDYHPDLEIMKTYMREGDNLIALLAFAAEYFTNRTPVTVQKENYQLRILFHENIITAQSFKRMVSTTTNGYGAVLNRHEYWEVDRTLSADAVEYRNGEIIKLRKQVDELDIRMAKSDPKVREKLLGEWKRELYSLNLDFRISGGWIFTILLFAALTVGSFTILRDWCYGFEWLAIIFGILFALFTIGCTCSAYTDSKKTQEANQARANYLRKQINEIS